LSTTPTPTFWQGSLWIATAELRSRKQRKYSNRADTQRLAAALRARPALVSLTDAGLYQQAIEYDETTVRLNLTSTALITPTPAPPAATSPNS
jgi:hypothetical protein